MTPAPRQQGVQIDYSCMCSSPMFIGDAPHMLTYCDVHRDGRPVRLRSFSTARMPTEEETPCPKREDKQHCNCWYDGEACCACGDNPAAVPAPETEPDCQVCRSAGGVGVKHCAHMLRTAVSRLREEEPE